MCLLLSAELLIIGGVEGQHETLFMSFVLLLLLVSPSAFALLVVLPLVLTPLSSSSLWFLLPLSRLEDVG